MFSLGCGKDRDHKYGGYRTVYSNLQDVSVVKVMMWREGMR